MSILLKLDKKPPKKNIYYVIYKSLVKLSYTPYPLSMTEIFKQSRSGDKNMEKFHQYFIETGFVTRISDSDPYYYLPNTRKRKRDARVKFGLYRITRKGQQYIERFEQVQELF